MALNYVTVTGTFDDGSGAALSGSAVFTPSETVYSAGTPLLTPSNPVTAQIIGGALKSASGGALTLLATDNAGLAFEGLTGFFYWTVQVTLGGVTQEGWAFFLPSSPSTVDLYSLAHTSAGGSGGFANPMTTFGDLIYENATPAAARLAGDTSNTRKFLRTQASGGVAQAPAWDTLQAGDMPAGVGDQAWQFRPETYGAKGDGKVIADLVLNGTQTATSATAAFTAADSGKAIMINGGAGATSPPLVTTITYVSATQVTLGVAASVSGSNFQAVYGTDDTAAINSAVTAAGTYALANDYFAQIVFGAKIYMLTSGPTQSGNGTSTPTFNAQIPLPYPAANGSSRKLVIALTGAGTNGHVQYWESLTPNVAGTALVSTLTNAPSTPDATFGNQSVIGGPSGSAGFTGGYANTKLSAEGISVWSPAYTNQYAFDAAFLGGIYVRQCAAHIFAPAGVGGGNSPLLKDLPAQAGFQNKIGCGMRTPVTGNNADCVVDSFTVEGYSRGMYVYDHLCATRIFVFYSDVALKIDTSLGVSGVEHLISIANFGCEVYNGGISTTGSGGPFVPVAINMDAEVASPAYDISDSGGILHGWISWDDTTRTAPTVTGAANVAVVNAAMGPGVWSGAPAAPASGVAQQNTAYRDAAVYVTSTAAITAVAVGGSSVFSGSLAVGVLVPVRVPSGKTYTITSAGGTLTTHWVLD